MYTLHKSCNNLNKGDVSMCEREIAYIESQKKNLVSEEKLLQLRLTEEKLSKLSQKELIQLVSKLYIAVEEMKIQICTLKDQNDYLFDREVKFLDLEKISKLLTELGIPLNCKGRKFLAEGIRYCIKQPEKISIEKELYPYLSNFFAVYKEEIRKELRIARKRVIQQKKPKLKEMDGFFPKDLKKLNNGDFIYGIIAYIKSGGH